MKGSTFTSKYSFEVIYSTDLGISITSTAPIRIYDYRFWLLLFMHHVGSNFLSKPLAVLII